MRKAPLAAAVVTLLTATSTAQTPAPAASTTRYSSEDMRTQLSRFTATDMLNVVTASVLDLSEDGRFVAFTERRAAENSETDNYRYGDPTFMGPAAVRLVVVNTDTGARMLPLGEGLLNVRQASFSRDGSKLAILLASGASSAVEGAGSLTVWPTATLAMLLVGTSTAISSLSSDTIVRMGASVGSRSPGSP